MHIKINIHVISTNSVHTFHTEKKTRKRNRSEKIKNYGEKINKGDERKPKNETERKPKNETDRKIKRQQ